MGLRILLAQTNPLVGDVEGNADALLQLVREQTEDFDLMVLPELYMSGYPAEDLLLWSTFQQRIERACWALAAALPQQAQLLIGSPWQAAGSLYNAALLLRGGQVELVYRKQCLPNYGVFDERRYFAAGDSDGLLQIGPWRLGVTICEDLWQHYPVNRLQQQGVDAVINMSASPYHRDKRAERIALLSEHSRRLQRPFFYVNQFGGQDELVFDGDSMVLDAAGECCLAAAVFAPSLLAAELLPEGRITALRGARLRPLADIAVDYQAIVCALGDYVRKNRFSGVVLGLSGGIDSALTLCLAVDALGAKRVQAVMLPTGCTSALSLRCARQQAEMLAVDYQHIAIDDAVAVNNRLLAAQFAGLPADTTEENIQARCRGLLLMALSNKQGRLLLATGNKSELAVGYATLYGDMAGAFAPLKDLWKGDVYRLAAYCNRQQQRIPQEVIERPPSAELAPDQRDDDTLPPYPLLDRILRAYIEHHRSPDEIIADGIDADLVYEVIAWVLRNEYKRRQGPPGVKLSARAFGRDRRYPITCGLQLAQKSPDSAGSDSCD